MVSRYVRRDSYTLLAWSQQLNISYHVAPRHLVKGTTLIYESCVLISDSIFVVIMTSWHRHTFRITVLVCPSTPLVCSPRKGPQMRRMRRSTVSPQKDSVIWTFKFSLMQHKQTVHLLLNISMNYSYRSVFIQVINPCCEVSTFTKSELAAYWSLRIHW